MKVTIIPIVIGDFGTVTMNLRRLAVTQTSVKAHQLRSEMIIM